MTTLSDVICIRQFIQNIEVIPFPGVKIGCFIKFLSL